MSDYKETSVSGSSYQRCSSIEIANGFDKKSIHFYEQKVFNMDDGEKIIKGAGQISKAFTPENASTSFDLLDPTTNTRSGASMTFGETYAVLYSLYLHLASERDAEAAAEEAATQTQEV